MVSFNTLGNWCLIIPGDVTLSYPNDPSVQELLYFDQVAKIIQFSPIILH